MGAFLAPLLNRVALHLRSLRLLFIARLLAGIFAGNLSVAQASLADMTNLTQKRAVKFNFLEIGLGLGLIIGPFLGVNLLKYKWPLPFSYDVPFYVLGFLSLIVFILFINYFIETNPSNQQAQLKQYLQPISTIHSNWQLTLKQMLQAFKRPKIRRLFIVWGISMLGYNGYLQFFTPFLKQNIHLNMIEISHLFTIASTMYIILQIFFVFPILKSIRADKLVKPSLLIFGLLILCLGFSQDKIEVYCFRLGYMLSIIVFMPSFNTIVANVTKNNDQGQIFGAISAIYALVSVLAALIFGWIMNYSTTLPIIIGGILILLSGILLVTKF